MGENRHKLKAAILKDKRSIILEDIPDPGTPAPDEVRVKNLSVGICGSDVHYYTDGRIGSFIVDAPLILGHEACGIVEQIGENVTKVSIGDFVALEPGIPCKKCKECFTGNYNLCKKIKFWATPPVNGALTEYVLHPEIFTFKLPSNINRSIGPLIEPLSVAVHAITKTGIEPGDIVFINGSGTVGCLTSVVAKTLGGSYVISSDNNELRLDLARKMGVDKTINIISDSIINKVNEITKSLGVNLIYECSGYSNSLNDLIPISSPGGKITLIGMGNEKYDFDAVDAMSKELQIYTVFRYANSYFKAIEIAKNTNFNLQELITDRFNIDNVSEAFEYASNPEPRTCKILIDFTS